jgi:predicted transposase YbfD/YdcC
MDDLSASAKPRLRLLLDHFSKIEDTRQLWRVAYPLREILFLVVCGTIASGDDYDDIVDWGMAHLGFLRGFAELHHGILRADWLRTLMNRINPDLFKACFSSWVAECWPDKPDLVASTAKPRAAATTETAAKRPCTWFPPSPPPAGWRWARRRSTKNPTRSPPFRPCWNASTWRARWSRSTPWTAIPPSPSRSSMPRPTTSGRQGQPADAADIKSYFDTAPCDEVERFETSERSTAASRFEPESRIERASKIEAERRSYISSRALSAEAFAGAARGHWAIENNLHWTLDVTFNEDQSRLRAGHGAKNMAVVRHFALNLVRQVADKRSIKRRRKRAAWDPKYLLQILGPLRC